MFGSVYLGSLRNSDSGLLNMSNLNTYLCHILRDLLIAVVGRDGIVWYFLPEIYADGVFT